VRAINAALFPALVVLLAALGSCGVDSPVSRQLGARCDSLDDCDDRCLSGFGFPGGLCSKSCDRDADCPTGASCVELQGGVCLFACRDDLGCEFLGAGWSCQLEPERGGRPGAEVLVCLGPG
jgi:hypothetical protein